MIYLTVSDDMATIGVKTGHWVNVACRENSQTAVIVTVLKVISVVKTTLKA